MTPPFVIGLMGGAGGARIPESEMLEYFGHFLSIDFLIPLLLFERTMASEIFRRAKLRPPIHAAVDFVGPIVFFTGRPLLWLLTS